mgnify:CR=1 FL=1
MTDEDTEERLQELREEESTGNRIDRDNPQTQPDFVDELVDALDKADDGDISETITAYDPTLAALLTALDEDDRLEEVVGELQDAYLGDAGISKATRSAVIRLAIRVGLQETSSDVMEDLAEAIQEQQTPTV